MGPACPSLPTPLAPDALRPAKASPLLHHVMALRKDVMKWASGVTAVHVPSQGTWGQRHHQAAVGGGGESRAPWQALRQLERVLQAHGDPRDVWRAVGMPVGGFPPDSPSPAPSVVTSPSPQLCVQRFSVIDFSPFPKTSPGPTGVLLHLDSCQQLGFECYSV